jgi:GntR family transcriptional repressor for pyruvate dehydrogenase complex
LSQRSEQGEVGRVIGDFVAHIRRRGYEPGERVASERDLADRFKVGRGVVREALSVLETMRVVECRPNSGIYLRRVASEGSLDAMVLFSDLGIPASNDEVVQLVEMRRLLEVQTVALAAVRWDEADMAALDRILVRTESRIARGESIVDEDADFHLQVVACAKNQFVQRVAHSYYLASRHRRVVYFGAPAQCRASHEGHVALRDALHRRDVGQATATMEAHLAGMTSYWLDRVDPSRPPGA